MPLVAIAIFIALALSQGHVAPFDRALGPGYTLVATDDAYGIVIDARFAPRFLGPADRKDAAGWTPTRSDIVAAEQLLRPRRPAGFDAVGGNQLKHTPESLVSRTWYGAVIDGQRLLFVDGYCSGGMPSQPLTPTLVLDGGSCYWYATIDADTWDVLSYSENGEA